MSGSPITRRFLSDEHGSAVLEFALVAPVLLMMLMGIAAYGGYFWIAHSVQQAANDAARAAIGGLDQTERQTLAQDAVDTAMDNDVALDAAKATLSVQDDSQTLVVRLSYDASSSAFLHLALLPMPSSTILRTAAVHLSGL